MSDSHVSKSALGLAHATHSTRRTATPLSKDSVNSVRGYVSTTEVVAASYRENPDGTMSSTKRPIMHIDRRELYTSLEARIEYLHSFLDFTADDVNALITGSKYIRALIPAIVNIVYRKLLRYDITAQAFTTRSTSYEGELDEYPDEDSPQIRYRKMFLRGYLQKLCSDPSKFIFWEYLDKVGMMHVGLGRKHPLNVSFIHLNACMGYIQDVLFEAILSHPRLRMEQKMALIKALIKVMTIQNDLFAKWQVKEGDEFRESESEIEVEQEGYLHGKKVNQDPGAEDKEDSGSEGTCPFSGMAKEMGNMSMEGHPGPRDMGSPRVPGSPKPADV